MKILLKSLLLEQFQNLGKKRLVSYQSQYKLVSTHVYKVIYYSHSYSYPHSHTQMIETGVFDDVNKLAPVEIQRSKSLEVVLEEEDQAALRQRTSSTSFLGKLFKPKRQVSYSSYLQ